jgi:hypothetical protein
MGCAGRISRVIVCDALHWNESGKQNTETGYAPANACLTPYSGAASGKRKWNSPYLKVTTYLDNDEIVVEYLATMIENPKLDAFPAAISDFAKAVTKRRAPDRIHATDLSLLCCEFWARNSLWWCQSKWTSKHYT